MSTEWIAPEHREIHQFLIHWGRWVRVGFTSGHCGSIEYRYRSPQCWYPPEPKPEPGDPLKAELIESLMRLVQKTPRKLLKFKYVYGADREWIQKRLRLQDFDSSLYSARQIILNLTRHKLAPTIHGSFHNLSLSDLSVESAKGESFPSNPEQTLEAQIQRQV